MRVLLVDGSRLLERVLGDLLQQHALGLRPVSFDAALASRDAPVVLLNVAHWGAAASTRIRRLGEHATAVLAICPDATRSTIRFAIARAGALDGYPDDPATLRLVALQAQRLVARSVPERLERGPLTLDGTQHTLSTPEQTEHLTPGETQVLGCLWTFSDSGAAVGLTAGQVAELLHLPERSVRNHVYHVRSKLLDLLDDVALLVTEPGGGYRLDLGRLGKPTAARAGPAAAGEDVTGS